jgi:GNAT superfamily N-acetyltransferase
MSAEEQLFYMWKPAVGSEPLPAEPEIELLDTQDFLAEESACSVLWELIDTQFRTRSKFLAIWPSVRTVAVHRDADGFADGFLLISKPVNWQIDYVVVRPDSRGQGIATKLVRAALAQAAVARPPYVMLTSKASLRPLYETCGFRVITAEHVLPQFV